MKRPQKKGFVLSHSDSSREDANKKRLLAKGIAASNIITDKDPDRILQLLGPGDTVAVCSLTEISAGILNLLRWLTRAADRGLVIESEDEPWLDMRSKSCNLTALLHGLLEFGHAQASRRTRMALARVRAEGRKLGRPGGISNENRQRFETGMTLYRNTRMNVREICRTVDLDPRSFYRYLKKSGIEPIRRKLSAGSRSGEEGNS